MAVRAKTLANLRAKAISDKLKRIATKDLKVYGFVSELAKWRGEMVGVDCDYNGADAGN